MIMKNTFYLALTLLLFNFTSFGQNPIVTVDISSLDFEDMDRQMMHISNGKTGYFFKESTTLSIEVWGLPAYLELRVYNKRKGFSLIKRIWVEQTQITLKGSISNLEILPHSPTQSSVDEHYSSIEIVKPIDPDLISSRPYLAYLANSTPLYTSEYISKTISQLPDSLQDFWATKQLNIYLSTLDAIDYNTSTKKLTSFSAINRENEEQKVTLTPGKYLLLDFSGPGCIPCLEDIDKLVAFNTKYLDKLDIVVIWDKLTYEQWMNYMPKFLSKITYPNLLSTRGTIFKEFDVTVAPTYILFNPDGTLQKTWKGRLTKDISKYLD